MAEKPVMQQDSEPVITENLTENPIENLDIPDLKRYIDRLYKDEFENKGSITAEELWVGAKLARYFGNHDDEIDDDTPQQGKTNPSITSASELLGRREKEAIRIQRSLAFWDEPKDLLVTLVACCMASLTQGWDQVANGNLGWPQDFGLSIESGGTGKDIWKFGAINAITWFSAAVLGPFFVDPVCHSRLFGRPTANGSRRGAVFLAAVFSFASMVGGSRAQSWQGYLVSRLFLGIGIGSKASIVPIWESEILPKAKRGRLLVSWQVFTVLRSPRWLILQGRYTTVSKLLKPSVSEVITFLLRSSDTRLSTPSSGFARNAFSPQKSYATSISRSRKYHLIRTLQQTERSALLKQAPNFDNPQGRIGYFTRLKKLGTLVRNRRAAIASMIVMLSQQLSGINILAFLASTFFSTVGLNKTASNKENTNDSLGLAIGFGAANAVFSAIAYWLIEPLEVEDPLAALEQEQEQEEEQGEGDRPVHARRKKFKLPARLYGRRALLLLSLSSGAVVLFILTFLLEMKETNSAKLPLVVLFIILFTLCYSPGAGCVPFIYSAEVWPNEGREIGMSWAVFWNFLGAGFLALFVPRGFLWGHSKLFGLFTGLSALGFLLVWLFVPATDYAMSLEDMSAKFKSSLKDHGKEKLAALKPGMKKSKVSPSEVNGAEDRTEDETVDKAANRADEGVTAD
ncbi:major facilitator superfamily domain-containing protein [Bisporella sp. PMI_857]|nr:major facilitator superfamily domain-containing protein [Bisporella sp. PMI_857]